MAAVRSRIREILGSVALLALVSPAAALAGPADPCADRARLNGEFAELQLLIEQDKAFISDLGFESRAEQFEREAEYYQELINRHPIAKAIGDGLPDLALSMLKTSLEQLTPEKAALIAERLRRVPKAGPQLAASMLELGQTPAGVQRLAAFNRFMGLLDPVLLAFKLGTAEESRDVLIEAATTTINQLLSESSMAARAPFLMNFLAAEIAVVVPLVWTNAEGWLHWPSVKRLLELNDSQLTALNQRTRQLQQHIERRKQLRAELDGLAAADCDSTKMVRSAKKPGSTLGTRALIGAAAAGAGVALGLAFMPALDTLGASCGAVPTIPNSCLGIGRDPVSCNAAMERYREWCSCNGRTFDTSSGSCR